MQAEVAEKPTSGRNSKDENSGSSQKIAKRTEDKMTPKMKLRRDRFVQEYIVDFNGTLAALRIGIPAASASKQASELLREPYVQKKLQEYILLVEEDVLVDRKRVLAGLVKEANWYGMDSSHSARVQAYGKLAKILGMEIENIKQDVTVRGGVMIVPVHADINSWEQQAAQSQKQLKQEVRK